MGFIQRHLVAISAPLEKKKVAINVRPVNYAASVFVCKSNKLWTLVLPTFTAVGVHQVENKYVTLTLLNDLIYWVKE